MAKTQTPQRPYLYRALHEWMTDNGQTPHIVVDAQDPNTRVPQAFVEDGRIVLNVSYSATHNLTLGNDAIEFQARFGGNPFDVSIASAAVLAIYARETGEGMVFTDKPAGHGDKEPGDDASDPGGDDAPNDSPDRPNNPDRSHLRVIK